MNLERAKLTKVNGAKLKGLRRVQALCQPVVEGSGESTAGAAMRQGPPTLFLSAGTGFFYAILSSFDRKKAAALVVMVNSDNGKILAWEIRQARSFMERLIGVFSSGIPFGSALHIHRCGAVNTFFMSDPVDVLYLNESGQIVWIDHHVQPGAFVRKRADAVSVVKLPAGTVMMTDTKVGQAVDFKQAFTNHDMGVR